MILSVLGSNSSGNCYVLHNDKEALILEAGIKFLDVQEVIDFNLSKIVGCLVTHEHGDHSKFVEQYLAKSVDVFTSQGTIDGMKFKKNRKPIAVELLKTFEVGNFKILAFPTEHDTNQPVGFLIKHDDFGTLLFATDTYYLKYKFGGLTNIMIECNYDIDILNENVDRGKIHYVRKQRTIQSHMSLKTCKDTLLSNDLSKVDNIVLIHLSRENSNEHAFKKEIQGATGKMVHVAKKGIDIYL